MSIPVVDTLEFLGLRQKQDIAPESAVLVLRFAFGQVGLSIDDVIDIVYIREDEIAPMQTIGLRAASFLRGLLKSNLGTHEMLIDGQACQAVPHLASLASMSRKVESGASNACGAKSAHVVAPFLTFDVDGECAAPLTHVDEVIRLPQDHLALPPTFDGMLGVFFHRDEVFPLVDLASLLGRQAAPMNDTTRVMIVRNEGRRAGLVVHALKSIENARWVQPAPDPAGGMRSMTPLVELALDAELPRTLPRLDLHALTARLPSGSCDVPGS